MSGNVNVTRTKKNERKGKIIKKDFSLLPQEEK